ncbi:MAG: hypothetical protein RSC93_08540 [Erysipelotrichaceae bacterium]
MNKFYNKSGNLLSPQELADAANQMNHSYCYPYCANDFDQAKDENSRISGAQCNCNGNGTFVIDLSDEELNQIGKSNYEVHGGKRWFQCSTCKCFTHL